MSRAASGPASSTLSTILGAVPTAAWFAGPAAGSASWQGAHRDSSSERCRLRLHPQRSQLPGGATSSGMAFSSGHARSITAGSLRHRALDRAAADTTTSLAIRALGASMHGFSAAWNHCGTSGRRGRRHAAGDRRRPTGSPETARAGRLPGTTTTDPRERVMLPLSAATSIWPTGANDHVQYPGLAAADDEPWRPSAPPGGCSTIHAAPAAGSESAC